MDDKAADPSRPSEGGGQSVARRMLEAVVRERGWTRREEPFRLSSGGYSHDYVDMRRAVSRGDDLRTAAVALLEHVAGLGLDFDAIGGMTMGADPVAHAVALLSGKDWFSVRKAEKTHGSGRRIEGADLGPATRVLLFEDTASTGASSVEAAKVVLDTGADIVLVCSLLDRGGAAPEAFAALGLRYEPVLTYTDLGMDPIGKEQAPPAS